VITARQLREAGLSDAKITRWTAEGHLCRRLGKVYTLGHGAISQRGELIVALFYAGPGAGMSHMTGAWWWGAIEAEPSRIHVSARHSRPSTRDIRVHCPRELEIVTHRGLPVTPVPRTVLDNAAHLSFRALRRLVAEVEFRGLASIDDLHGALTRGHPGSRALRRALAAHQPQLARTRSPLEERFVYFCEQHRIPVPLFNKTVCGFEVDAVWYDARLIVELDGRDAHAPTARMENDRHRDLVLRTAGFDVWRYTWRQLDVGPTLIAAELRKRITLAAAI